MRIGAFELNEPLPELNEPHVLAMLQPWIDIGGVGTMVISWLEMHFRTRELARLARPGTFFDFTRYRPTIYYQEGRRQMSIPNVQITYGKRKTGNDLIFLHLLEPHSNSELYVESILRVFKKFGAKRYTLLGSMYDLVPHTRPLIITGGGVGEGAQQTLDSLGVETSAYEGPTTIAFLISQRAPDIGIENMSLIVHLPQYTQLDQDYTGTSQLMSVLGSIYDIPIDDSYRIKAQQQMEQIQAAMEKNPQLKTIVEQLEKRYDARTKKNKEEEAPRLSPEIEKFLNEMEKRFGDN